MSSFSNPLLTKLYKTGIHNWMHGSTLLIIIGDFIIDTDDNTQLKVLHERWKNHVFWLPVW